MTRQGRTNYAAVPQPKDSDNTLCSPGVSRRGRTCLLPPGCGWGCRKPAKAGVRFGTSYRYPKDPTQTAPCWTPTRSSTSCHTLALSSLPFHSLFRPLYSYRRSLQCGGHHCPIRWAACQPAGDRTGNAPSPSSDPRPAPLSGLLRHPWSVLDCKQAGKTSAGTHLKDSTVS